MNKKLWNNELRRRSITYKRNSLRYWNGRKVVKQIVTLKKKRSKIRKKTNYDQRKKN